MKHVLFGLIAIVFALVSVAFTKETKSPKATSFWFQLDPNTGAQIPQSSVPANSTPDPYSCLTTAAKFCSQQYSQYETVPGSPGMYRGKAGTEGLTHKKAN